MADKPKALRIEVVEIRGKCPVYNVGDAFLIIEGFKLLSSRPLCMHSLVSLLPYYVALARGLAPRELGLARDGETAYVQCLDPCSYTGGGTVVFAILHEEPGKR